jgi:hypothetical protein
MKTSRNILFASGGLLVLAIATPALLGATVVLVAQRASPSVTSVPVCIKGNGQVRVLIGAGATCATSEHRIDWVVGGAVTDITLGQGLIGRRDGGRFQLAVSPTLLERGRIFSGFNDGAVPMPTGFPVEIARLDLPAGSFAISAKLTVTNTFDERFDDRVLCALRAEADVDQAELVLPEDVNTVIQHPYNAAAGLTMQLVHQFSTAGSVTLSCYEQDSDPDLSFQDLKITAIEGSSLSNVFLAVP